MKLFFHFVAEQRRSLLSSSRAWSRLVAWVSLVSITVSLANLLSLACLDILITEDVTVQITNITLEVDEKSTDTSRSVLKMQHLEAHPALLQAVAGYDFSDSEDEDDFDSDDEDDEDDDDLNEDELADMSKLSKMSAASSSSKKSANGKAAEEEDDEEDDVDFDGEDDEESSSDEEEDDFDRQEAEVQICSLLPGKVCLTYSIKKNFRIS